MNHPMSSQQSRTLIIGIGNEYRGDDAAGLRVARCLKQQAREDVTVLEQSGEGATLMETWKEADAVILIDAVQSGAKAGTMHRLDAHTQTVPAALFHCSTHGFSVAEAIELARVLGELPRRLLVYGIEGKNFTAGNELSGEVERAVYDVVKRVIRELARMSRRDRHRGASRPE
jgi:hydrogenase maturation protease